MSSYWTIRWLPTTIIWRTFLGASQEIWTFAVVPLSKVSVMNAVSATPFWKTLRAVRGDLDDRLVEPVEEDREIVRREVAHDAVRWYLPRFMRDEVTK